MRAMLGPLAVVLLLSAPGSRLSAQDGQVVFERTGYRLTSIGGQVAVSARVLDGRRRAVPNAPIAWRIEDSAVATVNTRGQVQSRRVGRTRLWAVSGRDSASALILVDQWAARFAFQPGVLAFSTMGESRQVQMQARDAAGNAIPSIRLASACRVLNPRIASMQGNGQITANASGVTWMRCTDRGVADSLRIEVRPRAASAAILDKAIYTTPKTVGDSFQVRMRAIDSRGQPIADARPTWASLEPRVLTIDPLSGWARGIGVGSSRVVAQLGDITDTVDVSVIAGAGMNFAPVIAAGESADTVASAPARAELQIFSTPTAVGDTTALTILPREATGAPAEATAVRLRISGDTTIARLSRDRRLVGLKEGQVYIIGMFREITDSLLVTIRPRGSTARVAEENQPFVRPSWGDTALVLRANRAQADSAMRQILAGSSVRVSGTRMISAQALVAQVSHSARFDNAVAESRTGIVFGGLVQAAPVRKLQVQAAFRLGTLAVDAGALGTDMDLVEAEGRLAFIPTDWVAAEAAYTLRALTDPIGRQRWSFPSASVRFRPELIGNRFRTVVGFTLIPVGSLSEQEDMEARAIEPSYGGEAGLEFRTGFFTASAIYHTERLNVGGETAEPRQDRFSMLRLRLGFQLGQ